MLDNFVGVTGFVFGLENIYFRENFGDSKLIEEEKGVDFTTEGKKEFGFGGRIGGG